MLLLSPVKKKLVNRSFAETNWLEKNYVIIVRLCSNSIEASIEFFWKEKSSKSKTLLRKKVEFLGLQLKLLSNTPGNLSILQNTNKGCSLLFLITQVHWLLAATAK